MSETTSVSRADAAISLFHGAVRFALEIVLLSGYFYWGWRLQDGGIVGLLLGALFVAIPAAVWGIFGARNDPSRGKAIVLIPGWARVALELTIIGICAAGIWTSWSRAAAETLLTAFLIHYALMWERTWDLIRPSRQTTP